MHRKAILGNASTRALFADIAWSPGAVDTKVAFVAFTQAIVVVRRRQSHAPQPETGHVACTSRAAIEFYSS